MSLSAFPLMGFLPAGLRGSYTICSEYETRKAQYAYRCVMLPDLRERRGGLGGADGLNAPTGAWCSLTIIVVVAIVVPWTSQCTYRCVVLPDIISASLIAIVVWSQCTYRCVVLPDGAPWWVLAGAAMVSMHLQVRGAP